MVALFSRQPHYFSPAQGFNAYNQAGRGSDFLGGHDRNTLSGTDLISWSSTSNPSNKVDERLRENHPAVANHHAQKALSENNVKSQRRSSLFAIFASVITPATAAGSTRQQSCCQRSSSSSVHFSVLRAPSGTQTVRRPLRCSRHFIPPFRVVLTVAQLEALCRVV